MDKLSNDSSLLIRYLLGTLPETHRDLLEEKFFTENDLFIELLDAEDRLVNDYLDGRLSDADRERFERCVLTLPDDRADIEVARFLRSSSIDPRRHAPATLSDRLSRQGRKSHNALRSNQVLARAAAVILVVIALACVWLVFRRQPASHTDSGIHVITSPSKMVVISLELSPGRLRSGSEALKIVNVSSARAVELKLATESTNYSVYRVRLQRMEKEAIEILANNGLKSEQTIARERIVTWEISTDNLSSGDYQVKLDGVNADGSVESIGTYYFKVAEK